MLGTIRADPLNPRQSASRLSNRDGQGATASTFTPDPIDAAAET